MGLTSISIQTGEGRRSSHLPCDLVLGQDVVGIHKAVDSLGVYNKGESEQEQSVTCQREKVRERGAYNLKERSTGEGL